MFDARLVPESTPAKPAPALLRAREQLERLYRTHGPRLLRRLSRQMSAQDAQDVLHHAFVRLSALSEPTLTKIEKPESYLTTIAANLIRDATKTAHRRADHLHSSEDVATLEGPCPVAALEARDMIQRLETSLLGLKPRTRAIFLAHRLDGLSYAEIAAREGLSIKGVEKQMSKAIAHLDRFLSRSR